MDSNPGPNPGFTVRPLSTAGPSTAAGGDVSRRGGSRPGQRQVHLTGPRLKEPARRGFTRPLLGRHPPHSDGLRELGGRRFSDKAARESGSQGLSGEVGHRFQATRWGGRGRAAASLRCDRVAGQGGVAAACGSERRAEAELPLPEARCLEPGVSCPEPSFRHFPSLLLQDPRAGKRDTRPSSAAGRRFTGETGLAPPPFLGLGLGRSAGLGGPSVDAMSPTSFQ